MHGKVNKEQLYKSAKKILKKNDYRYKNGVLSDESGSKVKKIGNFILIPIYRIDDDIGGKSILLFAVIDGIIQEAYIVNANDIEKKYFLNDLFGGLCNIFPSGNYQIILSAFKLLLSKTKVVHRFAKLGWQKIEDRMVFVHGGGVINWEGEYLLHDSLVKYTILVEDINPKEAFKHYLKLFKVARSEISYSLIAHTLTGVLFDVYKALGIEVDSVLMLFGVTGSLKTVLSYLVGNVYNKGKTFKHDSFESTINEITAFISEIAVVGICDDLRPGTNAKERQILISKAEGTIRGIGDINGKGRLKRDLTRHEKFIPNCSVIMTSEYSITGNSTVSRTNMINMSREDINFDILNEVQENEKIISTVIHNFIEWIAANYKMILKYVEEQYTSHHNILLKELKGQVHLRKPKMIALYLIALDLFFSYGQQIDAISGKKSAKIIKKAKKIFVKSVIQQMNLGSENDPINMYFNTLFDLTSANKVRIAPLGKEIYDQKLIGFQDDRYYYFIPNEAYDRVFKAWRARGREFPLSESDLKLALENKGIIEVEKDKKGNRSKTYKKKTVWKNHRIRVMNVKKSALKRYMKGKEDVQDKKDDECELVFKKLPNNSRSN